VNGTKRSPEGLSRTVSVAHGDREQILIPDDISRRNGHSPPPHVVGHRHTSQRREHASSVIARRPHRPGELVDVEVVTDALLDFIK
jgi:hypothetical protein